MIDKSKRMTIWLTENLYEDLREEAHKKRTSVSEIVRVSTLARDKEAQYETES